MAAAPNPRDERTARVIDREIAPLWHDRFARMMWRHLAGESPALVLDVHAGSGRTAAELMHRLPSSAKVIALEPDPLLREIAKSRLSEHKDRVYIKAGGLDDLATMSAGSYDLVLANLVLGEATSIGEALRELLRVTKPGGQLLATLPLEGSWAEAEDLYREVLRDAELRDVVRRLRRLGQLRPTGTDLARTLVELGSSAQHFVIEQERFELLFAGGREFLFAPVVELGPLRMWKAIIGDSSKPQELFWRLKQSVDTYFSGHVLGVTVVAGLIRVRVPTAGSDAQASSGTAGKYWSRWPELDQIWTAAERVEQASAVDVDIDIDVDAEGPGDAASPDEDEVGGQGPRTDSRAEPTERAARSGGASSSMSMMSLTTEDAEIFALLEQPATVSSANDELDALLDQVLEFAGTQDSVTEIDDDDLQESPDEPGAAFAPGDTMQRIRALLPPPPGAPAGPPPPPPRRKP